VIFEPVYAFLKMEVIHSPGAVSFKQQGRCGAVDNFPTLSFFCQNGLCFALEDSYQYFSTPCEAENPPK
jgi:hypothetical protein